MQSSPQQIIDFWFSPPMNQHWFSSTPEVDQEIHKRFHEIWLQASRGELDQWQVNAEGCLALVILLDQFPLNMFRGQPESFSTEARAVSVCKYALSRGYDLQLPKQYLGFMYMPLMHSELLADQVLSVAKYEAAALESNLRFAKHHRGLIERFGRFPHRNRILGRESSKEELAYLNSKEAFTG